MLTRDVYIWSTFLDPHPSRMRELYALLTPEERCRAGRLKFADHRDRFIAARALLRRVLGLITEVEPHDVLITTSPNGRPKIDRQRDGSQIDFNLSHSHTRFLLAVARDRRVGIDLENTSISVDCDSIARNYFHPGELIEISRSSPTFRREAFFAIWSSKEAYLKAIGDGLGRSLQDFCVSGAPAGIPRLKVVNWDASECQRWTIVPIPIAGYAAAVVGEGSDWQPLLIESGSYDAMAASIIPDRNAIV